MAADKRLPHGVTNDLVWSALWRLYLHGGKPRPVSRGDLVRAVSLPGTTVDKCLRALAKLQKLKKIERGLYVPSRETGVRDQSGLSVENLAPWSQQELKKADREPLPPGSRRVLFFPGEVVLVENWMSLDEYTRSEARRQRLQRAGVAWSDDLDL